MREFGFDNLYGVDPSPRCVAQASAYGRIRLGSLDHLAEAVQDLGQFDLVVLSHVLEHVRDFGLALRMLKEVVAIGGCLYVEVPDATRYADHFVTPFHYFDTEHINHFSLSTLGRALAAAGFVEREKGIKEVPITEAVSYPACWSIGVNFLQPGRLSWERDDDLKGAVNRYIKLSHDSLDQKMIDDLAVSGQSIIIWGVGCSTTRLLANSALGSANIRAFVDSNPATWGQVLQGCNVISPNELKNFRDPIVIASKLYGRAIYQQIRHQLGLENEVVFL